MADIYIPHELLIRILIRLPPQTLLKFLCVSKSWYALITSPNFISSHLLHHHHHQSLRLSNNLLFVLESKFHHSIWRFGHARRRTVLASPSNPNGSPFSSVAGSCNGVVCLFTRCDQTLCLWNPGIRRHLDLGPLPFGSRPHQDFALGFGFNSITNDYKIVAIAYCSSLSLVDDPGFPANHPLAHIYSFNGGTWNCIDFPESFWDDLSHISEGVFVNGFIHWILSRGAIFGGDCTPLEYAASILTFDLRNDVFGELEMPPGLGHATDPDLCLSVIDNSLALLHLVGEEPQYVVWQMKDYGLKESWEVLFSIKLPPLRLMGHGLGDVEDKCVIVTSSGSLIAFDEGTVSSTMVDGEILLLSGQAFSHTESLVLLDKLSRTSWQSLDK